MRSITRLARISWTRLIDRVGEDHEDDDERVERLAQREQDDAEHVEEVVDEVEDVVADDAAVGAAGADLDVVALTGGATAAGLVSVRPVTGSFWVLSSVKVAPVFGVAMSGLTLSAPGRAVQRRDRRRAVGPWQRRRFDEALPAALLWSKSIGIVRLVDFRRSGVASKSRKRTGASGGQSRQVREQKRAQFEAPRSHTRLHLILAAVGPRGRGRRGPGRDDGQGRRRHREPRPRPPPEAT